MKSRYLAAILGIATAIQFAVAGIARGDGFADCVHEAASATLAAKTEFQRDLRNLIVQQRPEFETLATIIQNLQIRLAEARLAKYDYLLNHARERINTKSGLSQFSNFDWSDEDTEKFKEESDLYRALETQITALQKQNNGHPDWPKLREHFLSDLNPSEDFMDLMTRLQVRQNDVKATLANCNRD